MHQEIFTDFRFRITYWIRIALAALMYVFISVPALAQTGGCNVPPVPDVANLPIVRGQCAASVTQPTATDNCIGSVTGTTTDPMTYTAQGTYTVHWTYSGGNANTSTQNQTVIVHDTIPPVIFAPGNMNVNANAGVCTATGIDIGIAVVLDNCGFTLTNNAPVYFGLGANIVTWTATDVGGNTVTANQTINIIDLQAPIPNVFPLPIVTGQCSATIIAPPTAHDNCAGTVTGTTTDPTTYNTPGTYIVNWDYNDGHNNISNQAQTVIVYKPTCSIAVIPNNNTYTGGVPTNVYLGYGPQKDTLRAIPGGGGTGFTYSWSPSTYLSCTTCQSPVFSPTTAGTFTYTVTVTKSRGCSSTCTVTFCVKDIRVTGKNDEDDEGNKNNNNSKVYLCHVPNGNANNAQTLSISINAVAAHLSNHAGDHLGQCNQVCGKTARGIAKEYIVDKEVKVYPNPNNGSFVLALPYIEDKASITVTDVQGKVIGRKVVTDNDGNRISFDLGNVAHGMYFVEVAYSNQRFRAKLIIQ